VGRGPARRVRDLPAGASRLDTQPVGLHGVWVNGSRIADGNGFVAGARPQGRVLREFAA
jgi:N-acyl-D-amino-acid deacylase